MSRSIEEITQWILLRMANELHVTQSEIRVDQPILASGIDSVKTVSLMSDLEDWAGFRFPQNPLDNDPTPTQLAQLVFEEGAKRTEEVAEGQRGKGAEE
jgi:acyl carrier protein